MSDSPNDVRSFFREERELVETLRPVVARTVKNIGDAIVEGIRTQTRIGAARLPTLALGLPTQTRIGGGKLPTLGLGLRSQLRGPSDISCGAGG